MTEMHNADTLSASDPTYDPSLTGEFVERFDPDVADDLGIAIDDESLQRQIEAGKAVGRLMTKNTILLTDGALEHAQVEAEEGHVTCANCNKPGCPGCGRS